MSTAEYKATAAQLREGAERGWALRESREQFRRLAKIYDTLAKANEALERCPF